VLDVLGVQGVDGADKLALRAGWLLAQRYIYSYRSRSDGNNHISVARYGTHLPHSRRRVYLYPRPAGADGTRNAIIINIKTSGEATGTGCCSGAVWWRCTQKNGSRYLGQCVRTPIGSSPTDFMSLTSRR